MDVTSQAINVDDGAAAMYKMIAALGLQHIFSTGVQQNLPGINTWSIIRVHTTDMSGGMCRRCTSSSSAHVCREWSTSTCMEMRTRSSSAPMSRGGM